MNNGTFISAPVSKVAGFVAFVAVSPLKPGSVSVINNSTNRGGSTPKTFPLYERILHTVFSLTNLKLSPKTSELIGTC